MINVWQLVFNYEWSLCRDVAGIVQKHEVDCGGIISTSQRTLGSSGKRNQIDRHWQLWPNYSLLCGSAQSPIHTVRTSNQVREIAQRSLLRCVRKRNSMQKFYPQYVRLSVWRKYEEKVGARKFHIYLQRWIHRQKHNETGGNHHHNHNHISLSSSQPPPLVTIVITATIICHHHHHNHHHLSPSSIQPTPSVTIIITTTTICQYHQNHHHHLYVTIIITTTIILSLKKLHKAHQGSHKTQSKTRHSSTIDML